MVRGKIGKAGVSNYANATQGAGYRTFAVSGRGTAPARVSLSSTSIPAGSSVGTALATITASGSYPFTFSILSDPSSKFSITAPDQLVLAGAIGGAGTTYTVQIQATNDSGSANTTFTMTVV